MSSPAAASTPVSTTRRRPFAVLATAVTTVALTVALLVVPAWTSAATAATRIGPRITESWARSMLGELNNERRAHHLRALSMNVRLIRSAFFHNYRMAHHNELTHQFVGEAFFSTRMSNQGYRWSAAGENVGWTNRLSLAGIRQLEQAMYDEVAPNDGHRRNILSGQFTQIGIQVRYDAAHHKLWFTQDFGRPA